MSHLQPTSPATPLPTALPTAMRLGPELTIAYAATCRDTLLQALQTRSDGLSLDLSGVTDFDSAGVQLLLATACSLQRRGQRLHIAAASPAVHEGLVVFGLQALLTAPAAATH